MRILVLTLLGAITLGSVAAATFEALPTFQAKEVLSAEELKGEHHEVVGNVPVDYYYFVFDLKTDYGDLHSKGLDDLHKRIREMGALESLNEVSKSDVFMDAAGDSLESMGEGIVQLAQEPKQTAKRMGAGIKRFSINLGRKSKRAWEDITDEDEEEEAEDDDDDVADVANSAFGVNKAARAWAEKLNVDPYSRNPILQKTLIDIAQVDSAGRIITKVVVPVPTLVSATNKTVKMVWKQDPEALRKINEANLAAIGVSEDVAKKFFNNESFTISDQTRFTDALANVGAEGLDDYVDAARRAESAREAVFFVESAEMLEDLHTQQAVSAVLTDSRSMVALTGDRAVVLYAFDYIAWTEHVAEVTTEIAERARAELGASELELKNHRWVSPRARAELESRGWVVTENVPAESPFSH